MKESKQTNVKVRVLSHKEFGNIKVDLPTFGRPTIATKFPIYHYSLFVIH